MKLIPNLITLLRIFIIPWIPYVFLHLKLKHLALLLVIIAAITDFLDGFIARRYSFVSLVGQVLDPLADKLFLITIVFTLFISQMLPKSFVLMFFSIEAVFILVGAFLWFYNKSYLVKAGPLGKIATVLFFIVSVLSFTRVPQGYLIPVFYLVLVFKLLSMFSYGSLILKEMQRQNSDKIKKKASAKDPD